MSEQKKSDGDDPFAGLDWEAELENWDHSTAQPGGAEVPEAFSRPPPAVAPSSAPQTVPQPDAARLATPAPKAGAKPLYRPPPGGRASGSHAPAFPPPPKKTSDRPLPSILEDEGDAHQIRTRGGGPSSEHDDRHDHDDDEGRTVVAPVSQDLLDQLEAAGIRRGARNLIPDASPPAAKKPAAARANEPRAKAAQAASPVEIDLGGMEDAGEEHTQEHPGPQVEDSSVVTSAPDVRTRGAGKPADVRAPAARTAEAPVRDGKFDPFHGMDLEPPVSETVGGPKLIAPEQRVHSADDATAVFDKKLLGLPHTAPRAAPRDADATIETATPFAGADPFATRDPFAGSDEDAQLAAVEADDAEAAGIIDLLHGEDASSDALPAISSIGDGGRPAAEWVAAQVDAWRARSERVAADARTLPKARMSRGLVVASELAAIAGDRARAIELAEEAWNETPNDPLVVRQLRQLLAAEGRWEEVAPLLEGEAKTGSDPNVKAHAALLAADAARIARAAPDEATKLFEAAQRVSSHDIRPSIARAVGAIAQGKPLPLLRWPQNVGAEPLAEAVVRRARGGEPTEDTQLATILEGIGAFAEGGAVDGELVQAFDELASKSESLADAGRWVRLGLEAARPGTRRAAVERLEGLGESRAAHEARLQLSLDLGDVTRARAAAATLAQQRSSVEGTIVHQTLEALGGATPQAAALASFAGAPGVATLARGFALAADEDPPAPFAADDALDASSRVARRLAGGGHVDPVLRDKTSRGAQFGFALADAIGGGGPRATVEALTPLLAWDDTPADEALVKMLAGLAEADVAAAIEAARQAAAIDPTAFPAALALLGFATEDAESIAIATAEGTPAEARGAMLAIRLAIAAIRRNDLDAAKRASDVALATKADDVAAAFLSELRARRGGDFDGVIEAIRARSAAETDPVARASNFAREVLLLMGTDTSTSVERAAEASQLLPLDVTLRALYERIAGEAAQGRAEWRAEIAETLEGRTRAETLLDAAREAELRDDHDAAEKYAAAAEQAGMGPEAAALRHRAQARGDGAARLADELLEAAKRATDPEGQREAYEALADLDLFARGDTASAIMWHQAILETTPEHLPSLRRLEHMLISVGREEDYEGIASQLARVLPPDSRDAHAEVAARLRLRQPGAEWDSVGDLIDAATVRDNPSLWATRMLDALARARNDDVIRLRALDLLLARADRPIEVAALATRAAESSFRLGDVGRARAYLERALEADPQHPTALASLAELRRSAQDFRGAAEAIEAMAQNQLVAEHRLEDWHAAAVLWLDKVQDEARGRAALERAAEIDLRYADVFDRLVGIARRAHENEVVADLYQRRIAQIEDPSARAQFQVEYAGVLVELGERDAARATLAAALELVPGHLVALESALRLAEQSADWPEFEQLLIKLSRVQPEVEGQVAVLKRLGALYEGDLPNPSRAEAVYRKILEHEESNDEIRARLVAIYVELGDAEMAVETHQERVRLANDPAVRRARLLELARLLDEVSNDPERALKALEQARASDPSDLVALTALAEFHTRHGRPDAIAAALDQAIEELRTRLAADPGDLGRLQQLAKILSLRGRDDAARVIRAAVAGLSGEPGELIGAEDAASIPELDELLCPTELSPPLRAFLDKAGEAIEKSVPVDLRALKAAKLGTTNPPLKAKIDAIAHGFGLPDADVVISRAMPLLCLPVGAKPFQIVIGEGLVSTDDESARRFALARTMKLCSTRCASLVRVPPADLATYVDALLHHLHPEHAAPAIDAERLDEITKRLQRFIPRKDEPELKKLASDLDAHGLVDVERLANAAAVWGDRVALLAVGDLGAALRGVAWTVGQKEVPRDPAALRAWLAQNPAARDMVLFAISDTYVEARKRAGVGG
ncbi:MAG: hypothetical protein HYV09_17385 [Deltaproteobacteria bacterium]|nr:hypothetical protein [Deltaproteobacteria bacterium]